MINLAQVPSFLRPDNYLATKRTVESVEVQIFDSTTNCKLYDECADDCLPTFANLGNSDARFNDKNSHLYATVKGASVIATLTNQNGFSAVITNSNYGDFYPMNNLKLRYWGFIMDWFKIATLEGFGKYNLNIEILNVAGTTILNEDFCYRLMPFSCDSADGTVRITALKNGYIVNGIDYRQLSIGDWIDQIRLYGRFDLDEHTTEVDNLQLNNGDLHQIQTQIIDNYTLRLEQISSAVSNSFIKDDLLSNRMYIDDYNRNNVIEFKQKYVSLLTVEQPIKHVINGTLTYNIKMTEFNQSTLKRNF